MVNRFKFGKEKIEALIPPATGGRATCYDTEIPKLALRITSSGTKTFYVIKRTDREVVWFKLGVFPDMTVEQARKEAQKSLAAFASNQNPAEIRRAQKQEPTFGEMFNLKSSVSRFRPARKAEASRGVERFSVSLRGFC